MAVEGKTDTGRCNGLTNGIYPAEDIIRDSICCLRHANIDYAPLQTNTGHLAGRVASQGYLVLETHHSHVYDFPLWCVYMRYKDEVNCTCMYMFVTCYIQCGMCVSGI